MGRVGFYGESIQHPSSFTLFFLSVQYPDLVSKNIFCYFYMYVQAPRLALADDISSP